jgi:anaerobic magnesium-protoporphyrin IX monomethyl ester cyclase
VSDLLLGQSYYLRFDPKPWAARQPYPPLGTLYAASLLRARGHAVALFDAVLAESEAEWTAALARHRPRVAVLFEDSFNYLSKMCLLRMRQAAFRMIDAARARGCTVVAAGSDATDQAAAYLARGADYVLLGEGDATLVELADALAGRSGADPRTLDGLAHLGDGTVRRTRPRPPLADLDAVPFPAWDLVDVARYREIWRGRHGYFSMNAATTRGCPYHCNWCAKPIWGQRYAVRSPENVVAEIQWLRARYAPDHLWFADDILGLRPGWLPRFADLVEEAAARIPFKCLSRADLLLRDGEVDALRRAGCRAVWMGAESGSQRILDAMEKGTRVEQIHEATRRLRRAGIEVGFFLQFGYPGETREDIDRTFRMVRECRPDDIGVSVSYPLPGTRFHARVRDQLGTRQHWQVSDDLAMLYRGPYPTAFYRQLHAVLHGEFRARRAWAELAAVARRPGAWRWRHLRRAASLARAGLGLPLARRRLERLARTPHAGVEPLGPGLDPAAAACPTPQAPGRAASAP